MLDQQNPCDLHRQAKILSSRPMSEATPKRWQFVEWTSLFREPNNDVTDVTDVTKPYRRFVAAATQPVTSLRTQSVLIGTPTTVSVKEDLAGGVIFSSTSPLVCIVDLVSDLKSSYLLTVAGGCGSPKATARGRQEGGAPRCLLILENRKVIPARN